VLKTDIEKLGAKYSFASSDLDPAAGKSIENLAQLRNLALGPLEHKELSDTMIIFLNDVAICEEDILELVHQRLAQKADMTCGMDWTYVGNDPTFYDVWIARGMNGDSFFEIPPDGNWNSSWNLFWNNPQGTSALDNHQPF
jgi:alpha-1,3-mannosyltransferase